MDSVFGLTNSEIRELSDLIEEGKTPKESLDEVLEGRRWYNRLYRWFV